MKLLVLLALFLTSCAYMGTGYRQMVFKHEGKFFCAVYDPEVVVTENEPTIMIYQTEDLGCADYEKIKVAP